MGAGSSKDAGIPTTVEFVNRFLESVPAEQKQGLRNLTIKLNTLALRSGNISAAADIEELMSTLEKCATWKADILSELVADNGLKEAFDLDHTQLLADLKAFVRKQCLVTEDKIRYLGPLSDFLFDQDCHPLDIFTTNYDLCIELFAKAHRLKCRDGFDPFWDPQDFDKPDTDLRLYKIHGSITWLRTSSGEYVKSVVKIPEDKLQLMTGDDAEPLLLYPMRKWQYQEPQLENLIALKRKLQSKSCEVVISVGYTFRDLSIRELFLDAARINRNFRMILIAPNAYQVYCSNLRQFDNGNRTPLYGRVACIPYAFKSCINTIKREIVSGLESAEKSLANAHRNSIEDPMAADWFESLRQFAECFHVDKVEEILSEKLKIASVTMENVRAKDAGVTLDLSFAFGSPSSSATTLLMALYYRANAYSIFNDKEEFDVALLQFALFLSYLLKKRCFIQGAGNVLTLAPKYNERIVTQQQHSLNTSELLDCVRKMHENRIKFLSLTMFDGVERNTKLWSHLANAVGSIYDHLQFWGTAASINIHDYMQRTNESYSEGLKSAFKEVNRQDKIAGEVDWKRLAAEVSEHEQNKLNVILNEIRGYLCKGSEISDRSDKLHNPSRP